MSDLVEQEQVLSSEFARVAVLVDRCANGPRLRVRDLRSGAINYFDPLMLEALVWASKRDFAPLVDPGAARWRDGEDPDEEEWPDQYRSGRTALNHE